MDLEYWFLLVGIIILGIMYWMNSILYESLLHPYSSTQSRLEGFENPDEDLESIAHVIDESKDAVKYLENEQIYDDFYAKIYDQLSQGSVRTQAEVGLALNEWTKKGDDLKTFQVLDAGCGTGIAVASLAKIGCKKVVGFDKSESMLNYAKEVVIPQSTLTDEQKKVITWRKGDLIDSSSCSGGEFSHTLMLYFTIYYFPDKETVFRNIYYWTKPGGRMVIAVVNKHKFDPMLESASPWLGFSLQKYSETRIKKSEVTFNKFQYTGEFDLQDPGAEFREVFRFKDGKVRRHKHIFRMEDMEQIVKLAQNAGWSYIGYVDLTPIAFEYAYHLHFKRN